MPYVFPHAKIKHMGNRKFFRTFLVLAILHACPFYSPGQVSREWVKRYSPTGSFSPDVATGLQAAAKAGSYSTVFDASAWDNGVYYYRLTLQTEKKVFVQTGNIAVVK